MASDRFIVSCIEMHVWPREDAIQRGLLHGNRLYDLRDIFPRDEGQWAELRLSIQANHPEAKVTVDSLFLTRILDDGVMAAKELQPLSPNSTPLTLEYNSILWDYDFYIADEQQIVLWLAEARFLPPTHTDWDHTLELVLFLPKRFVPGLEYIDTWTSKAWTPTPTFSNENVDTRRPAQVLLIKPDLYIDEDTIRRYDKSLWHDVLETGWVDCIRDLDWDSEGYACLVNDEGLFQVASDFSHVEERRHDSINLGAKAILCNEDGSLWLGRKDGLYRVYPDNFFEHYTTDDGLLHNFVKQLLRGPNGEILIVTVHGVSIRSLDGSMRHIPTTYEDRFAMDAQGSLWKGRKWDLEQVEPNNHTHWFGFHEGIEAVLEMLLPLPDGSMLLSTLEKDILHIHPNLPHIIPNTTLQMVATEGLQCGTTTLDGKVWLVTQYNHLVELESGKVPRLYVWSTFVPRHRNMLELYKKILMAPDGSLWMLDTQGISIVTADTLQELRVQAEQDTAETQLKFSPFLFPSEQWNQQQTTPKSILAIPREIPASLEGIQVTFAGRFKGMTQDEAGAYAKFAGAEVSDKLTPHVDLLVTGSNPGQPSIEARKLGVLTISQEQFQLLLQEKTQPDIPLIPPEVYDHFPRSLESGSQSQSNPTLLRQLAMSCQLLDEESWNNMIEAHQAFLQSGGAGGTWEIHEVSGFLFNVYQHEVETEGEQLSLARHKLNHSIVTTHIDLSFADLSSAFLEQLNFQYSNLTGSLAMDSFWSGTDFTGANLHNVDFSRSDLSGCIFHNANLQGAIFENTNLQGADFRDANIHLAQFPGANLADVIY